MKKNYMKYSISAALLLTVSLLIYGCGKNQSETVNQNPPLSTPVAQIEKIEIGYSRLRISLPVFVAAQKGYFKEEQLDVDLKAFDTAQPLMDALVAGHLNAGGFTAFPITFKGMQQSGTQLYFAGVLMEDEAHPISMLLKKKGSSISSIADLKGKRVGILPTIAYKAWLEEILRKNGVDPKEVTIVQVQPAMTASSLESGTIDAAFTNDPAATAAVRKGVAEFVTQEALVPKHLWSPFPFGSFNVNKDFADKNPELVKKVVRALDKAIDYINAHPAEAKETMKEYLPEEQRQFVQFYPDAIYLRSSDVKEADLKKMAESFLQMGVIEKPMQLDGLIYR